MAKEEEISKLREEMDELQQQLHRQYEQIEEMKRRLGAGAGATRKYAKKKNTPQDTRKLENYIGLNLIHLVGIVVLVIGLSIGVKYAIDKELISVEMRLGLAYAAGIVLFYLSHQLKKNYFLFSAILFSGAMATLYFTTYGAHVYYNLISFGVAFLLMIAFTFFTVYHALLYKRQEIALLGLVGAYAIPFLISKNTGRIDLLFSYMLFINTAAVYLAAKKQWNTVTPVAQYITWIIFIGWASSLYEPSFEATGILFMLLYFLLFTFGSAAPGLLHQHTLHQNNIYNLILNTIAAYIAALFIFGGDKAAVVTIVMSIVAAAQAIGIHYILREEYTKRMLGAFGFILFVTSIALQWDGITVTLLWLLVAVLVFALGLYRKWVSLRMTAILLLGATLFKLVVFDSRNFSTVQKVISYLILGILLLVISFFYQKFRQRLFSDD